MSEVPEVPSSDPVAGGPEGAGRRPILLAALGVAVLLIVVLVVVAVSGGDDDDDDVSTGGPAAEATPFWGTTWQIVSVTEGGEDTTPDLPEGKDLLDATAEGRIAFTGCNGGSGEATLDGDQLVVGDMIQTQMACEDQALMDHDAFMVAFLGADPTVAIEGDRLTLTGEDATIVLEALAGGSASSTTTEASGDPDAPVSSDGELWGSTWTITTIVDDGADVDVVPAQASGEAPEIDLTAEGTISFTGCNGGRAQANYGAGQLVVGPIMSTKMACDDAALMAQDEFLSSLLASVPKVALEGDTLTLASDQDQVVATRQS